MRKFRLDRMRLWFSLRATFASLIALCIGFFLKLESPQWAAITVWVVTQPSRGMTLSKAFYRFLGTTVGAIFALFLIEYFAGHIWLFLILLSFWVGLATGVANVVQYFRSYGSMLAGFTAALVGLSVFSHPDQAIEVAGSRVFAIFLGVAIALFMASLLIQSTSKRDLFLALDQIHTDLLNWAVEVFQRKPRAQLIEGERRLIARITQIEEITSYAAAESMQIRRQKRHMHDFLASLFATISSLRAVGLHWRKNPDLVSTTTELRTKFADAIAVAAPFHDPDHLLKLPNDLKQTFEADALMTSSALHQIENKVLRDRLAHFLRTMQTMVEKYLTVGSKTRVGKARTLTFHRDVRHARIVGLRSTLAMLAVSAFWLATGIKVGPLMVILTAVNCGIFATSNNPKSGILVAFRASLLAIAAAFICIQFIEIGPKELWFVLLLCSLFLIPGGIFVTHPTRSLAGTLFCANFLMFLSPTYPVQPFHIDRFAELGVAYFASTLINFLFFYLVLPSDPFRRSRNVIRDIVRDLERMAKASDDFRAFEWETLMYNRVSNLVKILAETGEVKHGVLEGSFAALDIGQEVLSLKGRLRSQRDVNPPALEKALESLSHLGKEPKKTSEQIAAFAGEIENTHQSDSHILKEIADLLSVHHEFFKLVRK